MEGSPVKVAVVGACGRMGQEACRALAADPDFELVVACDNRNVGESIRDVAGAPAPDIPVSGKLGEALDATKPDVLVELTNGGSAPDHALRALKRGVAVVVGASGVGREGLAAIRDAATEHGTPCLLVPNFALGAVLMMRFAEQAAAWFPDAEIVEMHHAGKLDAPSGTAMHTAEVVADARTKPPQRVIGATEKAEGARGAKVKGVPVHSVRLPGLVAHQMVVFGGEGELLTVRHDSMSRASFMEGLKLAVRKVRTLEGLVVGLDKVMFPRPERA
jgi:4-hydroxy-tetrahydrodipicolinate reductase